MLVVVENLVNRSRCIIKWINLLQQHIKAPVQGGLAEESFSVEDFIDLDELAELDRCYQTCRCNTCIDRGKDGGCTTPNARYYCASFLCNGGSRE